MGLIGEYIDYCFGSTKYDPESIREATSELNSIPGLKQKVWERFEYYKKIGRINCQEDRYKEVFHSQDKKECKIENCPYQKGYICMRPFMKQYEDIVCGECRNEDSINKAGCCKGK